VLVFLLNDDLGCHFIIIIVDLRTIAITVVLILRLLLVLVYVPFPSSPFRLLVLLLFRWGLLLLLRYFLRFPACWILTLGKASRFDALIVS
jgi:hypothetical protein